MTGTLISAALILPTGQPPSKLPTSADGSTSEAFEDLLDTLPFPEEVAIPLIDRSIANQDSAQEITLLSTTQPKGEPGIQSQPILESVILTEVSVSSETSVAKAPLNRDVLPNKQQVKDAQILSDTAEYVQLNSSAQPESTASKQSSDVTAKSVRPTDNTNLAQSSNVNSLIANPGLQTIEAQATPKGNPASTIKGTTIVSGETSPVPLPLFSSAGTQTSIAGIQLDQQSQSDYLVRSVDSKLYSTTVPNIATDGFVHREHATVHASENGIQYVSGQASTTSPATPNSVAHQTVAPSATNTLQATPIISSPAGLVAIVNERIGNSSTDNSQIVVQLDPPELGRISIDFKFDSQGLQSVIVSAETPEAIRQLKLMHHELVNALERQGLSSQDLIFKENDARNQHSPHQANAERKAYRELNEDLNEHVALAAPIVRPIEVRANDRIDIKV